MPISAKLFAFHVFIFYLTICPQLYSQIGLCWQGSSPPIEVGSAAPIPVPSHQGSIIPTNANNLEIHVYGTFTLDINNAQFSSCTFVMHPNSLLDIGTSTQIDVDATTFKGCYSMWQGINVPSSSGLIMQNSNISDEEHAVTLLTGALGAFFNNTFDRNWIGINAPLFDFTDYIWNNSFTCSSALYPPRAGQDSWAGISVNNSIIDVTVFLGGQTIFDGLQNGIIASNSIVDCNSCAFSNIHTLPNESTGSGVGIDAYANSQIRLENSTFELVYTGVRLNGSSLNMNNTTLTNGHLGVLHSNLQDPNLVVVHDNIFTTYDQAVRITKNGNAHIDIRDNQMTSDESGFTMIDILSLVRTDDFTRVNNNIINNTNTGQGAIRVRNCNFAQVNGNIIDYSPNDSLGSYTGISVFRGEDTDITNNELTGVLPPGGLTYGINLGEVPEADVCCNSVDGFVFGIRFLNECDDTDFTQNSMSGNRTSLLLADPDPMNPVVTIGTQNFAGNEWLDLAQIINATNNGDPVLSRFFVNNNALPVHPVSVFPGVNSWFVVDQLGNHTNCEQSSNCGAGGGGDGDDPFTPADLDAVLSSPSRPNGSVWYERTLLLERLENHPSLLGINNDVDLWHSNQNGSDLESLYQFQKDMLDDLKITLSEKAQLEQHQDQLEILKNQQRQAYLDLINNVTTQSQFIASVAAIQNSIDSELDAMMLHIQSIESGMTSRAQGLLSSLQNSTYTNSIASVQKQVMQILLNAYINGGNVTSNELSTLNSIASSCRRDYGQAVFWARSAMNVIDGSEYDELEGCTMELRDNESTSPPDEIILIQNPVNDFLMLNKPFDDVIIYDMNGNSLIQISNINRIDVSHLPPGAYLIRAKDPQSMDWMKGQFVKI